MDRRVLYGHSASSAENDNDSDDDASLDDSSDSTYRTEAASSEDDYSNSPV